MKKEETKPLTTFEETLLWSSIRYFVGRGTISAACHPADIITYWYDRIIATKGVAERLSKDIIREYDILKQWNDTLSYKDKWLKLALLLDKSKHYEIHTELGSTETVFEFNGELVPVSEYVKSPNRDIYINKSMIIDGNWVV